MLPSTNVSSWPEFHDVARRGRLQLLRRVEDFADAVHVIGCQRSGTTMLAGIINDSEGVVSLDHGRHHELDSALVLCGLQPHVSKGRQCFQTTYLNTAYKEYFDHPVTYKMVWVLRNPFSVIHSLLYNWSTRYLDMLFHECGAEQLQGANRVIYHALSSPVFSRLQLLYLRYNGKGNRFLGKGRLPSEYRIFLDYEGTWVYGPISPVERACLVFNSRVGQLLHMYEYLGTEHLAIVDYDDLVLNRHTLLKDIFAFLGLPFRRDYGDKVSGSSLAKSSQLTERERTKVDELSIPVYERARMLRTMS